MQLIKEIGTMDKNILYKLRKAARAILIDEDGKTAILHVDENNFYKIPGGGIEEGEDIITALKREIKEEAGAEVEVISELGITIEYRNRINMLQISYAFVAKAIKKGEPSYTESEKEDGFSLNWVTLDEGLKLFKEACNNNYFGDSEGEYVSRFMASRDYEILKHYIDTLEIYI